METNISNDSLIYGVLTKDTFNDFIARLHHDVRGAGVDNHYTADAIFNVMENKMIVGIDPDYANETGYFDEEGQLYKTTKEFFDSLDEEVKEVLKAKLDKVADGESNWYDSISASDFVAIVSDALNVNVMFTGYSCELRHVSTHLTDEAAEAYIKRNTHNHSGKMVVYVQSRYRSPEFTAIINGLLDGKIVYKEQ